MLCSSSAKEERLRESSLRLMPMGLRTCVEGEEGHVTSGLLVVVKRRGCERRRRDGRRPVMGSIQGKGPGETRAGSPPAPSAALASSAPARPAPGTDVSESVPDAGLELEQPRPEEEEAALVLLEMSGDEDESGVVGFQAVGLGCAYDTAGRTRGGGAMPVAWRSMLAVLSSPTRSQICCAMARRAGLVSEGNAAGRRALGAHTAAPLLPGPKLDGRETVVLGRAVRACSEASAAPSPSSSSSSSSVPVQSEVA